MKRSVKEALARALLCLADDELVLGHRDSEWSGYAPILEEDIAFANIALDEIGHAALWYAEVARLTGQDPDRYPDQAIYFRPYSAFRCVQLVEYPRGDWAFSMLRQYVYDSAELLRWRAFATCQHAPLIQVAEKIAREEIYHLRHTSAWITRLGLGTDESRQRLQAALEQLWTPAQQVLQPLPDEGQLVEAGLLPASQPLYETWLNHVSEHLQHAGLHVPDAGLPPRNRHNHSPHLEVLLRELQSVARSDPQAEW
jgi:ring-1,2-phenylacetyl-CoA epoxidase subunit PaaC